MSAFEMLSKREKVGIAVGGGVVLLLLVVVAVLVMNLLRPAPVEPVAASVDDRADSAEVVESEPVTASDPGELRFDENGMVEFPTTTDPVEAGIAAGAAMLSVDTSKVNFRNDFIALVADEVTTHAFNLGLVIETSGSRGEVVKLLPPLTIENETLEKGIDLLTQAIEQVVQDDAHAKTLSTQSKSMNKLQGAVS